PGDVSALGDCLAGKGTLTPVFYDRLAGKATLTPVFPSGQAMLAELLAQGGAVDAECSGSARLVAVEMAQYLGEQRCLDLAQDDVVELAGGVVGQVRQVAAHGAGDALAQ